MHIVGQIDEESLTRVRVLQYDNSVWEKCILSLLVGRFYENDKVYCSKHKTVDYAGFYALVREKQRLDHPLASGAYDRLLLLSMCEKRPR